MSRFRRKFVDGRYGQMHLRSIEPDHSSGRPLVCLHMFPQSGRNFEQFMAAMGTDRMVIAPDFPGYGESCAPSHPISATDYAASIGDVVEGLGLLGGSGKIDIFGIHAGSKLAVEFAYHNPEKIGKLALSSAAVLRQHEIEKMRGSLSHMPLDEEGTRFKLFWDMLMRNRGAGTTLEMAATSFSEMVRGGEKYSWGHRAVFEYNTLFPERLATLSHPIMLLNPQDDLYGMTPRSLPYLRNGTMTNLPGWGHGFLESRSDALAEIVREFLDSKTEKLAAAG